VLAVAATPALRLKWLDLADFISSLHCESRATYRISRNGQESIIDVDEVEAIEPVIRSREPGRYHVGWGQSRSVVR
jgi:hypothetical protein